MPLALFYHPPEEDLGSKALLKQNCLLKYMYSLQVCKISFEIRIRDLIPNECKISNA